MNILDGIKTRRSIRKYTDQKVEKEVITQMLEAAMLAPSAMNKQPWEFIIFHDAEKYRRIVDVHPGGKMLLGAAGALLVCCNMEKVHDPGYMPVDCSAATMNILLAAHGLGLGACWIGIHPRENRVALLKELFELPSHIYPFALVSYGYPAEEKAVPERFDAGKVFYSGPLAP